MWFGIAAYGLWGLFPLYFRQLERSGALEIVSHRILWSFVVCLVLVAATRTWHRLREVVADRRRLLLLAAGALVISLNWGIYVYAVNAGEVVQASLGYYINPLVTVLLGVVVLRERLAGYQWLAVGIGTAAVLVLTAAYGRPPFLALSLACSFGSYALVKNRVGTRVDPLSGLMVETTITAPLAAGIVTVLALRGQAAFTADPPWQGLLLALSGAVTVAPLLLFAASARRVPLSTLGLLQYLTPTMQLLIAVLIFGEQLSPIRWAGFALVWLALAVLTGGGLRAGRARAAEAVLTGPHTDSGPGTGSDPSTDGGAPLAA